MKKRLNTCVGLSLVWLCAVGANHAHAAEIVVKPGMKAPAFTLPYSGEYASESFGFQGEMGRALFLSKR